MEFSLNHTVMKKIIFPFLSLICLFCSCSKDNDPKIDEAKINGYGYVDLGLSVKWATCNIGAYSPEDAGDYYGWGSTVPNKDAGRFEDNPITEISGTDYDVVRTIWGKTWRIPTSSEMNELCKNCTWVWTTLNGRKGYSVTGPNGNSIFLPAVSCLHIDLVSFGTDGYYWTSTRHASNYNAVGLYFNKDNHSTNGWNITDLFPIRPVSE